MSCVSCSTSSTEDSDMSSSADESDVCSDNDESSVADIDVVLPVPIPYMKPLTLFWDSHSHSTWTITMEEGMRSGRRQDLSDGAKTDHSYNLLAMAFGHRKRWTDATKQYPVRLIASGHGVDFPMDLEPFSLEAIKGRLAGHLLRDITEEGTPYFYQEWLPSKPPAHEIGRMQRKGLCYEEVDYESAATDVPYVVLRSWPKKAGFFKPAPSGAKSIQSTKRYPRVHPESAVTIERHAPVFSHVGMLIPAITYALETHLVAHDLRDSLLEKLEIQDLSLILTAISSSSARGPTDYERIEFLGDSILKFCATVNSTSQRRTPPGLFG